MLPDGTIFISGIDTDAGKTHAAAFFAAEALARGRRTAVVKPFQTGCAAQGFSDDAATCRRLAEARLARTLPENFFTLERYGYPASPALAARLENRSVDTAAAANRIREIAASFDVTLVEGAGGLAVPLDESGFLTADWISREGWPLVLVANARLGAVNHTLLSLEAARRRNIR